MRWPSPFLPRTERVTRLYKALTYLNLPPDNRKSPGDKITKAELAEAGQDEGNIKELIKGGSISEDMNAPLDKSHDPVRVTVASSETTVHVVTGDTGEGTTDAR